jgi:phosphoglycolate phosphatase-like HAD superfamily hydrolase
VIALDVDGTLLDCRPRQVAVARAVAGAFDEAAFWTAKRAGEPTAPALVAAGLREDAARRAASEWAKSIEDDEWLALDALLPGAADALDALAAAGVPTILLTARRRPYAVGEQLARLGVLGRVGGLVVVDPADPAPAKAQELRKARAHAFVGDTESDASAAAVAGVPFHAVGAGQRSPAFLAQHGVGTVHAGVVDAVSALLYAASATT